MFCCVEIPVCEVTQLITSMHTDAEPVMAIAVQTCMSIASSNSAHNIMCRCTGCSYIMLGCTVLICFFLENLYMLDIIVHLSLPDTHRSRPFVTYIQLLICVGSFEIRVIYWVYEYGLV